MYYTIYRGEEPIATLEAGTPLIALAVASLRVSDGRQTGDTVWPAESLAAIATQLDGFSQDADRISIGDLWMPFDGGNPGSVPSPDTL